MFHIRLVWKESLRVPGEEGEVVVLCEVKEAVSLVLLLWLCRHTGVNQLVDVWWNLVVPLEVCQAVHQLKRRRGVLGERERREEREGVYRWRKRRERREGCVGADHCSGDVLHVFGTEEPLLEPA